MTQLWFPSLRFNGLKLKRGQLLNISLLGVGLVIPPWDSTLLPAHTFWEPFILFDSDWVVGPLTGAIANIPTLFIDFITGRLEEEAKKYKENHPERQ